MALPDRSIDPKLLQSGQEEFLKYGFADASLKRICERAGVTTGALYKRYKGKEELFAELVKDVIEELNQINARKAAVLKPDVPDAVLVRCWDMNEETMMDWFNFLDQKREAFTLLMRCAEGTCFEKFEHIYSEKMTKLNYAFYRMAFDRGIAKEVITEKDMHIADSAYWKAICEPFIHDYTYEEICVINKHICHFFDYYALIGVRPELVERYRAFNFNAFLRQIMVEIREERTDA